MQLHYYAALREDNVSLLGAVTLDNEFLLLMQCTLLSAHAMFPEGLQ